jgi:hypothetical protein
MQTRKFILLFFGLLCILFLILSSILFKNTFKTTIQINKKSETILEEKKIPPTPNVELHEKIPQDDHLLKKEVEEEEEEKIEKLIRKEKIQNEKCKSRIGRTFMTDNEGYFCKTDEMNSNSNCCDEKSTRKRYLCDSCSSQHHCCSIYENCVSCIFLPKLNVHRLHESNKSKFN